MEYLSLLIIIIWVGSDILLLLPGTSLLWEGIVLLLEEKEEMFLKIRIFFLITSKLIWIVIALAPGPNVDIFLYITLVDPAPYLYCMTRMY